MVRESRGVSIIMLGWSKPVGRRGPPLFILLLAFTGALLLRPAKGEIAW